jgi:glycosyltransferase involved in cell wall biosynthesis
MEQIKKLSVVVPIYNETLNIIPLHNEIKKVLTSSNITDFEIIYVNDGSTDNSLAELLTLGDVTIIDLNRNYARLWLSILVLEWSQERFLFP